ncbi:MAG: hypothetical protein ACU88J_04500 [Gammaproteobacteria bacterium]
MKNMQPINYLHQAGLFPRSSSSVEVLKIWVFAAFFCLPNLAYARPPHIDYVLIEDDKEIIPRIEVLQTRDASGRLRYTSIKELPYGNTINLRTKIKGRCALGYLLSEVNLTNQDRGEFCGADVCEVPPGGDTPEPWYYFLSDPNYFEQDVNYTIGNRTLGERIEDFWVPQDLFQRVIDYGNEDVALRAENIIQEENIRAENWTAYLSQHVSVGIRCKHAIGYTGIDKYWGYDTIHKPVEVVYRGVSSSLPFELEKATYNPLIPPKLTADVYVKPYLSISSYKDPNECELNLVATFTSTGPTTVYYRLVDELDNQSPLYSVVLDQTHTAFVGHTIDLSERETNVVSKINGPAFATPATDRIQGYYKIEDVSPHLETSNIASFNVEPCNIRSQFIKDFVGN